jgi:hypothetical protein
MSQGKVTKEDGTFVCDVSDITFDFSSRPAMVAFFDQTQKTMAFLVSHEDLKLVTAGKTYDIHVKSTKSDIATGNTVTLAFVMP